MSDSLHTVTVNQGPHGATRFDFHCLADRTQDPKCHMICERPSCEEGCSDPAGHVFVNAGECMILTWLENSDVEECIDGGQTSVTVPMDYSWHGEGVDWKFAALVGLPERADA